MIIANYAGSESIDATSFMPHQMLVSSCAADDSGVARSRAGRIDAFASAMTTDAYVRVDIDAADNGHRRRYLSPAP